MSTIISWDQLPDAWIRQLKKDKRKRGNPGKRHALPYLNIVTAFDIETSRIPDREEAAMYVWQWQFGLEYTVIGRTWDELRFLIRKILDNLPEKTCMVCLCHNLAFEFQHLRVVYDFQPEEVFAVDRRKILKCTMYDKRLEFRCTYLHSNMSLKAYLKKMGVEHQKISGEEYNYDLVRFPWTELSDLERTYITHDVLGLVEAYMEQMRRDGDTLSTIPMTSTGYVRRDAKRAMKLASRQMLHKIQPDLRQYKLLKSLFRGGNTHCNRFYAGRITPGVHSADRSSSYPDIICNGEFPITPFRWIENPDIRNIRYHIKKHHAVAFRVALWDVELKDRYEGFPYLPRDKCKPIIDGIYDNGRVLKAAYLETAVTDVDWGIIKRQYKWKHIRGLEAMWSQYGPLPRPLVLTCIDYYRAKTELKGVTSEDGSAEYLYNRSKELLNSLY